MTVREIGERVSKLKALVDEGDTVQAHIDQDELFRDVLMAISSGACDDPVLCAKAAMIADGFDFTKWYE